MSTLKQIETLLPSLTAEELKELKKQVSYFARSSAPRDVSSAPVPRLKQTDLTDYIQQELLYSEFSKLFAPEISPQFAFFLERGAEKQIKLFFEMSDWTQQFFASTMQVRSRVEYLQFCHFCVQVLADDLKQSPLPFCFRVLLNDRRWELLPGLIDARFPGYMQNEKFLVKILDAMKTRHKDG